MSQGKIRTVGSSLFLKNRYGTGYTLTLVKGTDHDCSKKLGMIMTNHVPAAKVLSDIGTELSIQLPLEASGR